MIYRFAWGRQWKKNMKKLNLFIILATIVLGTTYAQDHSPMYTWEYSSSVRLNGRSFYGSKASDGYFSRDTYADSYKKQDGYALVQGYKLHYWLYDTISYHDGNAQEIYDRVIPAWVEGMGYVIDYDNIEVYEPNNDLANSVKMLMRQRGADVSVTLVTKENSNTSVDCVVINEHFKSKEYYKTTVYYLYKDSYVPITGGCKSLSDYAQGQGWSVYVNLYWPKNFDDSKMKNCMNAIMQNQKNNCSECAENSSWIESYVSEFCMNDGTTYRIVSRYLFTWNDGDVRVYKGSMNSNAGTPMSEFYNSGWIKK